jgi:oligoribonuclease NrnB/cAMP/cGMP phosphodiesterase (DHH superfamily)
MKCFHHNDLDGRCAAAIVGIAILDVTKTDFVEIDYKSVPDLSVVRYGEEVFIVDFSFRPDDMDRLLEKTKNVIWIDHHATASKYPYVGKIAGLLDFTEKGYSGCELTWKFMFPDKEMPKAVELIGDYDSWRLKKSPDCFNFYEGMKLEDNGPRAPVWSWLFFRNAITSFGYSFEKISSNGKACIKYRDAYCKEMRQSFGYETEITGVGDFGENACGHTIKAYALNVYRFGSQAYGDLVDKYPIVIAYVYDGENYTVSMYSTRNNIHCGEICKAIGGGGGHKGAAGFICKELPFRKSVSGEVLNG